MLRPYAVAVATVAVAAVVATVARSAAVMYQRNFTPEELLEHVLMHEQQWTPVLNERVRNLPERPYRDREFDDSPAPVVDGTAGAAPVYVRPIVVDVLDKYADIGSFAEYGAAVVQQSLTCFAVRHLAFQTHYVNWLQDKDVHASIVQGVLSTFKDTIVMPLDKLTVMPASLQTVLDMYWGVARAMQDNATVELRHHQIPVAIHYGMVKLHAECCKYLTDQCTEYKLDERLFEQLNVKVPNSLLYDKVLNATINENELLEVGRQLAAALHEFYYDLAFDTMSRPQWGQIYYDVDRMSRAADELDKTNKPIAPPSQPVAYNASPADNALIMESARRQDEAAKKALS